MKYLRTLMLLFALLTVAAMGAQQASTAPVRWRTVIKFTGADEGIVTFKALVAPGWHLYGLNLPEGGPKPTSFDLSASEGLVFDGKPKASRQPVDVDDPLFGMTLSWWDANIEFTVPFKLKRGAEAPKLNCKISYMTCDGNTCMPPKTESVSTSVKKPVK